MILARDAPTDGKHRSNPSTRLFGKGEHVGFCLPGCLDPSVTRGCCAASCVGDEPAPTPAPTPSAVAKLAVIDDEVLGRAQRVAYLLS